MPTLTAWPGVYVEELPSGVRTITGVATSVTAFVGRTLRGAVDEPIVCFSFADFERKCGGLWADSELGYAVYQFFLNGAGQAVVSRVIDTVSAASATLDYNGEGVFLLEAANPGAWGNSLRVSVDFGTSGTVSEPNDADSFHLTIDEIDTAVEATHGYERAVVTRESYPNVSIDPNSSRYVVTLLEQRSSLARVTAVTAVPATALDASTIAPDAAVPPLLAAVAFVDGDDGAASQVVATDFEGPIDRLELANIVNLVCVPPLDRDTETLADTWAYSLSWCEDHRAVLLIDPPAAWGGAQDAADLTSGFDAYRSANAAFYFPRLLAADPLQENLARPFAPSGAVAGLIARTDGARGIWKAPAGIEAALSGVSGFEFELTEDDSGIMNPRGVNALRNLSVVGPTVWGARTGRGADVMASEWKYLPVRRTALHIEESLQGGTRWAVFEPNDEPLWGQLRLSIGAFMHDLFRRDAFQGSTPREAYLVRCDSTTTTQADIDAGIVNILVGFAPLKPAEFVVLKFQQLAGQAGA